MPLIAHSQILGFYPVSHFADSVNECPIKLLTNKQLTQLITKYDALSRRSTLHPFFSRECFCLHWIGIGVQPEANSQRMSTQSLLYQNVGPIRKYIKICWEFENKFSVVFRMLSIILTKLLQLPQHFAAHYNAMQYNNNNNNKQ